MVGAPLGGVWGIQWGGAGTSRRGGPGLRGGHWNPWNIWQLYSQVWGMGLPWGVAGKGLASLWVSEVQDPRSLLSLLSLPLPEWISKEHSPLCVPRQPGSQVSWGSVGSHMKGCLGTHGQPLLHVPPLCTLTGQGAASQPPQRPPAHCPSYLKNQRSHHQLGGPQLHPELLPGRSP